MSFDQAMESGNWFTPIVPAHLPILLNKGRGIGIKTCGLDNAFYRDYPRFGLYLLFMS